MNETPAQRRRAGAVLLAVIATSALVLAWPRRRSASTAAPTVTARGPATAGSLVPREARGVLRLDVAAMRRAAAFSRWFEAVRSSDDACAAALGERVTRVVVTWTATALEDFVVIAEGAVDEAAFRRCGGVRRGRTIAVTSRVEGALPVLVLSAATDAGSGAETWRLPSGVLLLGPPAALRAMVVEARAHPDASEVTAELAGLWADVPPGAAVAGVRRLSADAALDPALAHARALSLWVTAEGGAAVAGALVRCDDAAGATALAGAVGGLRRMVPDFTATAEDDRVRVRATLDAALLGDLTGLLAGSARP